MQVQIFRVGSQDHDQEGTLQAWPEADPQAVSEGGSSEERTVFNLDAGWNLESGVHQHCQGFTWLYQTHLK